ncbi:MAG TPA: methyltransferase domain-containing protein [Pyrinomonadaceae bacterium]|nr:methyltransferase domain-containing protein [Pyrinomonadaceae bacterium]
MDSCEVNISTARLATEKAPVPLAHQAVHDTVVNILQQAAKGKLLDVPAGTGALASRLIQEGFDVACCDLYPEIFRLAGVEVRQGDMGGTLPYSDESFDYITCLEGLEHIENPQNAIREFARALRPRGQLIASVPNILNIEERLKWLIYGYTSHFKPLSRASLANLPADLAGKEEVALHVNAISYSELRYSLEESGFEIIRLYRDKPKAHLWLYWPIVALIRLVGKLTPQQKRVERWTEELMSDEVLLGGNTLIVHAVKK